MRRGESDLNQQQLALLRDLWSTVLPDKEIAAILNRTRGSIRRTAEMILGLPPRAVARRAAYHTYINALQSQAMACGRSEPVKRGKVNG